MNWQLHVNFAVQKSSTIKYISRIISLFPLPLLCVIQYIIPGSDFLSDVMVEIDEMLRR